MTNAATLGLPHIIEMIIASVLRHPTIGAAGLLEELRYTVANNTGGLFIAFQDRVPIGYAFVVEPVSVCTVPQLGMLYNKFHASDTRDALFQAVYDWLKERGYDACITTVMRTNVDKATIKVAKRVFSDAKPLGTTFAFKVT